MGSLRSLHRDRDVLEDIKDSVLPKSSLTCLDCRNYRRGIVTREGNRMFCQGAPNPEDSKCSQFWTWTESTTPR